MTYVVKAVTVQKTNHKPLKLPILQNKIVNKWQYCFQRGKG